MCPAAVAPARARAMMPMRLLRIVHAVRKTHRTGRDDLRLAEEAVDEGRARRTGAGSPCGWRTSRAARNSPPISRKPRTKPSSGEMTIGRMTLRSTPLSSHQCACPPCDQMIECEVVARGGQRRAAQAADQRMAGTGRQAQPPGDQVPDRRRRAARRSAAARPTSTTPVSIRPEAIVFGDRGAPERADQVGHRRQQYRLARA